MKIQLIQEDLEKAVKDYLKTVIAVKDNQDFVITFNYTRSPQSFLADVEIINIDAPVVKPAPTDFVSRKASEDEVEPEAKEPVVENSAGEEAKSTYPRTSLFGNLKS